jgi:hypothetical protein
LFTARNEKENTIMICIGTLFLHSG